ncbi:MAG: DUF4920 domain-containing protein [Bacteroidetes bacterium]|jgi:hypothetical protein|nr:DUF4920 domain-containing protein [Bacteroidota bacterium]
MKTILSIFVAVLAISCTQTANQIGKPVNTNDAISVNVGLEKFKKEGKAEAVLFGKVDEVCQSEGCWFTYQTETKNITVDFGDAFTVPKNIGAKDLYAVGHFYNDTAEDKSVEVKFHADGVKFK